MRLLKLAWNDVRLTIKDRPSFFFMLIMPVGFMIIFGTLFSHSNEPSKMSLYVDNRDSGWLGAAFSEEIQKVEDFHFPSSEILARIEAGEDIKIRTLIIPSDFTEKVEAGEVVELTLRPVEKSDETYNLGAKTALYKAVISTLGTLIRMDEEETPETGEEKKTRFQDIYFRMASGRLITLKTRFAGQGAPTPSGFAQSIPGNLTVFVLMMTVIYGGVFLTEEKASGVLRRQAMLPFTRGELFVGKLLGRFAIALLQLGVLLIAGSFFPGISWGRSPLILAAVLLSYCFCCASLGLFYGCILRTTEQAGSIGWISTMFISALGGCWWPLELFPGWLKKFALILPPTWAMDGLHKIISWGETDFLSYLPNILVLLFMSFIFIFLGARFFRYE